MRNKNSFLALMLLCSSCVWSQKPEREYVLSYPYEIKDSILISQRLIQSKNPMTKEEALAFVYNHDSSMLICTGEYYDMYAEKVTGKWEEERLPKKCIGLKNDSFYLIAFTSYECQDSKARKWEYLNLALYDRSFNLKDTFVAYKGDEYDYEISSIINVNTQKILLYTYNNINESKEFSIIKVNLQNLKFQNIKTVSAEISSDNLKKAVSQLGLDELFYK